MSKKNLLWKGVLALFALFFVSNSGWLLSRMPYSNTSWPNDAVHPEVEYKLPCDVTSSMLHIYNQFAGNISTTKNRSRKLLFAFVSDNDMVVNAIDLMKQLGCKPEHPDNYHRSLASHDEICETILFFFTRGLGSEIYVSNRPEFDVITGVASLVKKKEDLGGNSAQMALRAFKEGADVYLSSMMSHEFFMNLYNSSITVIPQSLLREEIKDIHLVIDFTEGETYGNLECPRTNRLFLHSDQDNLRFPGLSELDSEVDLVQPDVFVISGFQLMNQREKELISGTLSMLSEKIVLMKQAMPGLKFHFEMGAFSDRELMRQLIDKIFYKIHSTGLNEQELILLTDFIDKGSIADGDMNEGDMSTNGLIRRVVKLIDHLTSVNDSQFERIHFHSSNIQMICSSSNWKNKRFAVTRSILIGLIQAMKQENDNRIDHGYSGNAEILESFQPISTILPSIDYESRQYSYHKLDAQNMTLDDLVQCWDVKQSISCCLAPALIHPSPARTCGLGDNIAATSLLYQISSKARQ